MTSYLGKRYDGALWNRLPLCWEQGIGYTSCWSAFFFFFQMPERYACPQECLCVRVYCVFVLDPYPNVTETWLARDIWGEKETSQRMSCLSPQLAWTAPFLADCAVYMWPEIQMKLFIFVRSQPLATLLHGFACLNFYAWSNSGTDAQNCEEATGSDLAFPKCQVVQCQL